MADFEDASYVNVEKLREKVYEYVKLRLGDGMVDVELEPKHYWNALTRSIEVFRTRSSAAVEESFAFLVTQKDVQIYTLPEEVTYVNKIWRRNLGDLGNAGTQVDPFSQGYLNVYILNSGRAGGVLNYELFKDYEFQIQRMFGGYIDFYYNSVTHKITLIRKPYGTHETLLLQTYNLKPEVQLLSDVRSMTFLKEYTYALCLFQLGQIREKYSSITSPNGQTSLNGSQLKAEGTALQNELHQDIMNYRFGETPLGIITG